MRIRLRSAGSEVAFEEHEGDLSLGGVAVPLSGPASARYEVRIPLPGGELRALGEPVSTVGPKDRLKLRFVEMDTASELTLARFLHDASAR